MHTKVPLWRIPVILKDRREKRDSCQMNTRTSRKRPAVAPAEAEEAAEESDDFIDGEPGEDNEAGSDSKVDDDNGSVQPERGIL